MSGYVSSDFQTSTALEFVKACLQNNDPTQIRTLASKEFQCVSIWNSGKEVRWENIEQLIGGLTLGIWSNDNKNFVYKAVSESLVEAFHEEKISARTDSIYLKVRNVWVFTFNDEGKISSVHITNNVSS